MKRSFLWGCFYVRFQVFCRQSSSAAARAGRMVPMRASASSDPLILFGQERDELPRHRLSELRRQLCVRRGGRVCRCGGQERKSAASGALDRRLSPDSSVERRISCFRKGTGQLRRVERRLFYLERLRRGQRTEKPPWKKGEKSRIASTRKRDCAVSIIFGKKKFFPPADHKILRLFQKIAGFSHHRLYQMVTKVDIKIKKYVKRT